MRHGQSQFQATFDVTGIDPAIEDARLTPRGWQQVRSAAGVLRSIELDLVVTSPFTRAIDTALGVVGVQSVPIVVDSMVRERLNDPSDVGRPASVLASEYPALDFAHLDEVWWTGGAVSR